ncbi:hypothetical protein EDB82DRAFT_59306 [Fusarium venenatum]|uniref:uncharacterized protein n=1 Tax=Fusarium venenatum TaxID=56646 RepID=UPI001DD68204|nr:hypothetical protein EDB82DRAFT_59306 [Fusarium venenatum]
MLIFMPLVRRRRVVRSSWLLGSSCVGSLNRLRSLDGLGRDGLGSMHRSLVAEGSLLVTVVSRDISRRHGRRNNVGGSGRLVDARVGRVPLLDLSGGCGVNGGSDLADRAVCDLGRAGSDSEVLGRVKSGRHVTRTRTISSSGSGDNLGLGDGAESGRERDGLGDNVRTFGAVGDTWSAGRNGADGGRVDGRGGVTSCHDVLSRNWVRLVATSRLGRSRLLRLFRLARLSRLLGFLGLLRLRRLLASRLGRLGLFLGDRAHGSRDSNSLSSNVRGQWAVRNLRAAGSDSSNTGSVDS